jgi:hypothetical protein
MKNNNIIHTVTRSVVKIVLPVLSALALFASCNQIDELKLAMAGPITISASTNTLTLTQKQDANTAVAFTWTTGTNHGTGASISYFFQLDKKGNGFKKAINLNMGKGVYTQAFTVAALNDSLLRHWSITPNTAAQFEARIITTVYSDQMVNDTSNVVTISLTPYQPVSTTLYLTGNASPGGTDLTKASVMTPSATDPTIFVYQGMLSPGTLKFITTSGQALPSYNKGTDDTHIAYRTTSAQADDLFSVSASAVYKVTVSLLDLTVTIAKVDLPAYSTLYIVGDAAPNGWDIANATPLVQDSSNPYIFRYSGVLNPGNFKFPVNRNTDWAQDMYMRTDDSHIYLHHGGASDDNKWTITKKGYYILTLNLLTNTINIDRTKLYMVGDATPIGWTIGNAIEMTEDATDGCIFTYSGPMTAGDFKFPVNRNSDWGQDMYMRVDDTHMYRHTGGAADDNKWHISTAGNYLITANIETLTLSIQKQ